MNIFRIILLFLGVSAAVQAAVPEVSLSVSCHQRWPWNGKVDVDYKIDSTNEISTPVYFVRFYASVDGGEPFALTTVSGEGALGYVIGSGSKRLTWDAGTDKPGVKTSDLRIAAAAQDVTAKGDYLCFDLSSKSVSVSSAGPDLSSDLCKTSQLWFKRVPAGTFTAGSPEREVGHYDNADTERQHEAKVEKDFYLAVFETTQAQYLALTGSNPSDSSPDELLCPVNNVSYNDLRGSDTGSLFPVRTDLKVDKGSFFHSLRAHFKNNFVFDLPTDVQWERACRAGTTSAFSNGANWFYSDDIVLTNRPDERIGVAFPDLDDLGWYSENTSYTSCKAVGQKNPNPWGFYDMHGNVWEWCLSYVYRGASIDQNGPQSGNQRSLRGGAWNEWAVRARSARDYGARPEQRSTFGSGGSNIGFRIAIVK